MSVTVKELKEWFIEDNIPDDAVVFVHADHGQHGEEMCAGLVSRDNTDDFNSMVWEFYDYEKCYDEEALESYPKDGKITAICLLGE
jgi:hypothetical protein